MRELGNRLMKHIGPLVEWYVARRGGRILGVMRTF